MGWGPLKMTAAADGVKIVHGGEAHSSSSLEIDLDERTLLRSVREKSYLIHNTSGRGSYLVQLQSKEAGDDFYARVVKILDKLKGSNQPAETGIVADSGATTRKLRSQAPTKAKQNLATGSARATGTASAGIAATGKISKKAGNAAKSDDKGMRLKKMQLAEARKQLLKKKAKKEGNSSVLEHLNQFFVQLTISLKILVRSSQTTCWRGSKHSYCESTYSRSFCS